MKSKGRRFWSALNRTLHPTQKDRTNRKAEQDRANLQYIGLFHNSYHHRRGRVEVE